MKTFLMMAKKYFQRWQRKFEGQNGEIICRRVASLINF